MAKRGDSKRKDIELWIADTNQETMLPLLDKGPFSPTANHTSSLPASPLHYVMTRRSPLRSPTLFRHHDITEPFTSTTSRGLLSVKQPTLRSHSTPSSPSYMTPSAAHLSSHSQENLLQLGPNMFHYPGSLSTGYKRPTHDNTTSDTINTTDHSTITTGNLTTTDKTTSDDSTPPLSLVTEEMLTILSEYIGSSKLYSLTTQLKLTQSDYQYAISNYRLPDTQALYILRLWYNKDDRIIFELTNALESIGLSEVALKLQNGHLKTHKNKSAIVPVVSNHSQRDTNNKRRYKSLAQCRGFSLQGEDGIRTTVIKKADFSKD